MQPCDAAVASLRAGLATSGFVRISANIREHSSRPRLRADTVNLVNFPSAKSCKSPLV